MSRYYGMSVTISGHNPALVVDVKAAAEEEWPFADWSDNDEKLTAYAENNLCGGDTEEEFTERLSVAVWVANGAFCDVTVDATYLDALPYETHSLDEDDYTRLIQEMPLQGECGVLMQEEGDPA